MAQKTVAKRNRPTESKNRQTLTPEQKRIACRFLERILDVEQMIGPSPDVGVEDETLFTINTRYHSAIGHLLETQRLLA